MEHLPFFLIYPHDTTFVVVLFSLANNDPPSGSDGRYFAESYMRKERNKCRRAVAAKELQKIAADQVGAAGVERFLPCPQRRERRFVVFAADQRQPPPHIAGAERR